MIVIEVAFFISILLDVAGADDSGRKEKMPKALNFCGFMLGHTMNNCMTVIELGESHYIMIIIWLSKDGELSKNTCGLNKKVLFITSLRGQLSKKCLPLF